MGIKFHCPNGHKLNVKAFLAGKKGVCPKCGTKVRIPLTSESSLADSDVEEGDVGHNGNGAGTASVMIATAPAVAAPVAATLASSAQPGPSSATALAAPPASLAVPAISDPITEAPTAIWYVRPPSGGQYGPARGDTMRTWLSEGRISADSHVWREGWTDWRGAGEVLHDLQAPSTPPLAIGPGPTAAVRPVVAQPAKPRGITGGQTIAILAGLAFLIVVLSAALAYILFFLK